MTSINQSVGNKDFSDKKNLYHTSGLSYPRDISATYAIWDFANIQARQHRLATEALAIWRYY
ncbi:GmrSD restriction endonuclease domain-containing protein [Bacillus toyonensis]|uniref:GmrSD restriction endonuclease domain-containing protein n=1 Tax=Bacillus toyonensis TaxID=155322 RepID=UPI0011A7A752